MMSLWASINHRNLELIHTKLWNVHKIGPLQQVLVTGTGVCLNRDTLTLEESRHRYTDLFEAEINALLVGRGVRIVKTVSYLPNCLLLCNGLTLDCLG